MGILEMEDLQHIQHDLDLLPGGHPSGRLFCCMILKLASCVDTTSDTRDRKGFEGKPVVPPGRSKVGRLF